MNNNISYIQPFSIPMVQMQIDEDTSELKSCDLHTTSNLQMQEWRERHDPEFKRGKNIERHRILEKFPKTKDILTRASNAALNQFHKYKNEFMISTSWLTKTSQGQGCNLHNHKNCVFSGVYYYGEYDDNVGHITFQNPFTDMSSLSLIHI